MNKQKVSSRRLNKKNEQKSKRHVFSKICMNSHCSKHGRVFCVPESYSEATTSANGLYAEIYEQEGK